MFGEARRHVFSQHDLLKFKFLPKFTRSKGFTCSANKKMQIYIYIYIHSFISWKVSSRTLLSKLINNFFTASLVVGQDPCTTYQRINEPLRSAGYIVPNSTYDHLICDRLLTQDWYRFTNAAGKVLLLISQQCRKTTTNWKISRIFRKFNISDFLSRFSASWFSWWKIV